MKKEIHPSYEKAVVKCACGNEFETKSTVPEIKVELCSACHPFYTGKQKLVDTAGRVDKFEARRKAAEALKKAKEPKDTKTKEQKDNKTPQSNSEHTEEKIISENEDTAVVEITEGGSVVIDEIPTQGVPEEQIEKIEEELEENTVDIEPEISEEVTDNVEETEK